MILSKNTTQNYHDVSHGSSSQVEAIQAAQFEMVSLSWEWIWNCMGTRIGAGKCVGEHANKCVGKYNGKQQCNLVLVQASR